MLSSCSSAGSAGAARMSRQPKEVSVKAKPPTKARHSPTPICRLYSTTSMARMFLGDTSAMYTGTTMEATPMATPTTARPTMSCRSLRARPISAAPTAKMTSLATMVARLGARSRGEQGGKRSEREARAHRPK